MAAIADTNIAHNHAGSRGRFLAAFQRMQENRARRAIYRQTVRELSALSNRELTDLGISRGTIHRLAHDAAWGLK